MCGSMAKSSLSERRGETKERQTKQRRQKNKNKNNENHPNWRPGDFSEEEKEDDGKDFGT